ncbi:selenocysteine-specific translation elongation factor [Mycolicibacillus parakoreensis]|uniref:Selenocysteine-specific translation elongation factor n=1 Tax=Mycolicibacillus parakoreensis TaxID=1069221 RepID=A0ABY3TVV2_9MYCO|nr:selenocysteine-specific translation elongation factor [Mycolicibacillus parakoreensis]MCV7315716.1 selenocysteine-specific translation elongation factor [Mycolicibacillus parakoreensis]ULN51847.1 selenocysteine-specific translation elongation factor [Mycolicibacillus parakoreensis]
MSRTPARRVVATAGHVDHGKTTLINALTGMQPDRWAEEHRRGLTIDLGFAWTTLADDTHLSFVDVPGHQRFLANTLAGLGPAPVVCFVVAADEGWQAQSADHRDAIAALGITGGVLVITRTDRAPDRVDAVVAQARAELAGTGLAQAPAVAVCAPTGAGLAALRRTLTAVLAQAPPPPAVDRLRLWVDRAFTLAGAGTVVTGTLAAGELGHGDEVVLHGARGAHPVAVRSLHSCGQPHRRLGPVSRVGVNLRGVDAAQVHRGDALLTAAAWPLTEILDVRRTSGVPHPSAPQHLMVHVGTAAVPARLRPLDDDHARITLARPLPLIVGDPLVLRHPGSPRLLGGARVLDVEPPPLRRRGAARQRAATLAALPPDGDVAAEVIRRGAVTPAHLRRLGLPVGAAPPAGVHAVRRWWVGAADYRRWCAMLVDAVEHRHQRDPVGAGLSRGAAVDVVGLPEPGLLDALITDTGLVQRDGRLWAPGHERDLGAAAAGITAVQARLAGAPFAAPEAPELAALHVGPRELAAAERAGRLLRLDDAVVVLPTAPALAMRTLSRLEQPFTVSAARRALNTTRRVALPLLAHLDARGWTRRVDATHREVVRPGSSTRHDPVRA